MRFVLATSGIIIMTALAACSSPQDRAARAQEQSYEAQEKVARHRLELVDKYQECVKAATGNVEKVEACDSYLRAAEALK
jgi:hypothetical protein